MKPTYIPFFKEIDRKYLQEGKDIYLYFIPKQQEEFGRAKLKVINGYPFADKSREIAEKYAQIDKNKIVNSLSKHKYRRDWNVACRKLENSPLGTPLKLNVITTALFGPLFLPYRSAQLYNVYVWFYFRIEDIIEIVDGQKKLFQNVIDKVIRNGNEYVNLQDCSAVYNKYKKNKKDEEIDKDKQLENLSEEEKDTYIDYKRTEDTDEYVKLKEAKLTNLMLIGNSKLEFSNHINIFVGQNDSGKTSILKYLYSITKSLEEYNAQNTQKFKKRELKQITEENIALVYNSRIRNLITSEREKLNADVKYWVFKADEDEDANFDAFVVTEINRNGEISLEFDKELLDTGQNPDVNKGFNAVFLPTKEVLSIYGAVNAARNFDGNYDKTYKELADVLIKPDSKAVEPLFSDIVEAIEHKIISGRIEYKPKDNKYVFLKKNNEFEIDVTSEGVKQIGMISTLIKKAEIRSGTILFIDEPDINMNPVAIRKLVGIFRELTKAGVQIFISTHSYYILNWMSILARRDDDVDISCFTINLKDNEAQIDSYDLRNGLPPTLIMDETEEIMDANLGITKEHIFGL